MKKALYILFLVSSFAFSQSPMIALVSNNIATDTQPVVVADYYVSSDGTGDGSTVGNPMSYADAKTQLNSMSAGEVMAFKRGDVFTSELVIANINGTLGNEIVLTDYGTGALPKIDLVAEFNLLWTPQGGNVWTTPDPGFGRRIKINGTEVIVSPIHSELGTDIGDIVMFTYDSGSLYYSGATDPNTLTIEAPTASRAIRVNIGSHFIIENIEIVGSTDQGVLLYGTDNVIIRNLTVGEMCKGGIALAYSATYGRNTNTSFIDNTVDSKYTLDYSGATQDSTTSEQFGGEDGLRYYDCIGGEVSGNYVKNWGHAGISMTAGISTSDVIDNIKIFDNTLTSPDVAYGGRFVAEYEFRNSEIYNNNFIELKNHSHIHGHDNHYHHNIFKDITESPIKTYRQYGVDMNAQYGDVYNNIVENNLFVNISDGAIEIEENGMLVYGNTFRNNISFECGLNNSYRGLLIYGGSSNAFNDNIFYIDGQVSLVYYYNGNIDVATFNTQTSNSNSISGNADSDPLFVGATDYYLTELSPAVNAATTTIATLDYEGNAIPYPGTVPDIGIYESSFVTDNLGSELVTNGDFENGDTDWTLEGGGGSSWEISGGVATRLTAVDWGMTQSILATAAVNYRISLDITVLTSGILRVSCGDLAIQEQFDSQGLGQTFDIPWGANDGIIKFSGTFIGSIDNVSVKEVLSVTPILSNFAVSNTLKDRVTFDSDADITGMTATGFVISGKTLDTSVDGDGLVIDPDGLGGYFAVTVDFNFWDNNTIRCGENSDLARINSSINNMTLEYIVNNINEPPATTLTRYVTTSATGSGDGTNDTTEAWTLTQAESAVAGTTVWIKAGDYGAVTSWQPTNSGTVDNPVKFIGYKLTTGDITENYLNTYDSGGKGISTDWNDNEMPTFTGAASPGTSTSIAIRVRANYMIIRNIQTKHYQTSIDDSYTPAYIVIENFNSKDNYHVSNPSYSGILLWNATGIHHMKFKNIMFLNHSMGAITLEGAEVAFNLLENVQSWCDRVGSIEREDYHITTKGNNDIIRNCHAENFNTTSTSGSVHGIGIKASSGSDPCMYNLFELNTSINNEECFYARNMGVSYNVFKDNYAGNNGGAQDNDLGGLVIWGGADYNIFERNLVEDMTHTAILFYDNDETPANDAIGLGNIIRNNIFNGTKYGIYIADSNNVSELEDTYIYNNTFTGFTGQFAYVVQTPVITNLRLENNIIVGASTSGQITNFTFDYNDFYNCWTTGIGSNDFNINPSLDANYVPQATFTSIDVPTKFYVPEDYGRQERNTSMTTVGAKMHINEPNN